MLCKSVPFNVFFLKLRGSTTFSFSRENTTWMNISHILCFAFQITINTLKISRSKTVSNTNGASYYMLKLNLVCMWTAFFTGPMCVHANQHYIPRWWHGSTTFLTIKHCKIFFFLFPSALWVMPSSLVCLWMTVFHHVACFYVFLWYNLYFICLVIFYNITNGVRGLIDRLQEPDTLLMSLVFFFLNFSHTAFRCPGRLL